MILSCWYVVLFVYHTVLVFLQYIMLLRRVEFLCMTLGRTGIPSLWILGRP